MTVPLHTLAGFLGSGKTTLLNHLIRSNAGRVKLALVVNEFGKVGIDGDLINRQNYEMMELSSGCVCCTLSGELAAGLVEICDNEKPDMILMESSGVANPRKIRTVFRDPDVAERLHPGNTICVVDANTFALIRDKFSVIMEQIVDADVVLVNKAELAGDEIARAACESIRSVTSDGCRIMTCSFCDVDTEFLLVEPTCDHPIPQQTEEDHALQSLAFDVPGALSLTQLRTLLDGLADRLVRGKGFIRTGDGVQEFQWTLSGLAVKESQVEAARSRFVLIGTDLSRSEIETCLEIDAHRQ